MIQQVLSDCEKLLSEICDYLQVEKSEEPCGKDTVIHDYQENGSFYHPQIVSAEQTMQEEQKSDASRSKQLRRDSKQEGAIRYFRIEETGFVLTTESKIVNSFLKAIKDENSVKKIRGYLYNTSYASGFDSYLEKLHKNMRKKYQDTMKDDEKRLAQNLTDSVLHCIQDYLLTPLMIPLHKRASEGDYLNIVEAITQYLRNAGIFTYNELHENENINNIQHDSHSDVYDTDVVTGADPAMDGIVKEILVLPYGLQYEDENGETRRMYTLGKLKIYQSRG